jgi:hypothetical protein
MHLPYFLILSLKYTRKYKGSNEDELQELIDKVEELANTAKEYARKLRAIAKNGAVDGVGCEYISVGGRFDDEFYRVDGGSRLPARIIPDINFIDKLKKSVESEHGREMMFYDMETDEEGYFFALDERFIGRAIVIMDCHC